MKRVWIGMAAGFALLGAWVWAADVVTLQGERTVYTVDCEGGRWQGKRCDGHLMAGQRYRFRALPPHGEVVHWIAASSQPSGKFDGCKIQDGRSWTCPPNADAANTITLQMDRGRPVHDTTGQVRAFHAVGKWRWWLAHWGAPIGDEADF